MASFASQVKVDWSVDPNGLHAPLGRGGRFLRPRFGSLGGFRAALPMSGHLAVLILLLAAGSLYISSLSSSGVHAMALSLPIGMAVAYFLQMVSGALRWVTLKVAGPLMADIVTGPNAPSSLHPAEVIVFVGRAFSLTLVPLLLWFGFVNHRSSERTVRRILQQAAAIALLIMTGIILAGGVLTFYELRSR